MCGTVFADERELTLRKRGKKMTDMNVTQEMIDSPFADAVLVNCGEGCAMKMEVVENYYIFFDIEMDQLPEDVDYSVENIIDEDDCRED